MEEERARLFAEISHELRTPLRAVQGFVEAIRDGIVQDEAIQKRYLERFTRKRFISAGW